MTDEEIRAVEQAATTPAQRLTVALAAVHAARPEAIRELTLDDIDLPSRRITIAGHRQRLGELTHHALLAWLDYRRATWPRHRQPARPDLARNRPRAPDPSPAATSTTPAGATASPSSASAATGSCTKP